MLLREGLPFGAGPQEARLFPFCVAGSASFRSAFLRSAFFGGLCQSHQLISILYDFTLMRMRAFALENLLPQQGRNRLSSRSAQETVNHLP